MSEGEDLEFFYQLVDGTATSSYAAHTALKAGMPESLVKRSLQVRKTKLLSFLHELIYYSKIVRFSD